jgi:hypothetical protein
MAPDNQTITIIIVIALLGVALTLIKPEGAIYGTTTSVSGTISGIATWESDTIWMIEQSDEVEVTGSLTIEPGTTVILKGRLKIISNSEGEGKLFADRVIFRTTSSGGPITISDYGLGIVIVNNGAKPEVSITNSYITQQHECISVFGETDTTLGSNTLTQCSTNIEFQDSAHARVGYNQISGSDTGAATCFKFVNSGENVDIFGNTIEGCGTGFSFNGIDSDPVIPEIQLDWHHNNIMSNSQDIVFTADVPTITTIDINIINEEDEEIGNYWSNNPDALWTNADGFGQLSQSFQMTIPTTTSSVAVNDHGPFEKPTAWTGQPPKVTIEVSSVSSSGIDVDPFYVHETEVVTFTPTIIPGFQPVAAGGGPCGWIPTQGTGVGQSGGIIVECDHNVPTLSRKIIWDFDDGSPTEVEDDNDIDGDHIGDTIDDSVTHTYTAIDIYTVEVKVYDDYNKESNPMFWKNWDGSTGTFGPARTIIVISSQAIPTAIIDIPKDTFTFGEPIEIDGSNSISPVDVDGDENTLNNIVDYQWETTHEDTGNTITNWLNIDSFVYTPLSVGAYTVQLTVVDESSLTDVDTFQFFVGDSPPIAVIVAFPSSITTPDPFEETLDISIKKGEEVTFTGELSTDPELEISSNLFVNYLTYIWDFGEGDTQSGQITNRQFNEGGEFIVTLTVIDASGNEDNSNIVVKVAVVEKVEERTISQFFLGPVVIGLALALIVIFLVTFIWKQFDLWSWQVLLIGVASFSIVIILDLIFGPWTFSI